MQAKEKGNWLFQPSLNSHKNSMNFRHNLSLTVNHYPVTKNMEVLMLQSSLVSVSSKGPVKLHHYEQVL
jgi:hypothetical protein